jgi:DNA-binding phage protein
MPPKRTPQQRTALRVAQVVDELHKRVALAIRRIARDREMPLTHLPDRAGVTRSHFWAVLAGKKSPTLRWLQHVAKALDVDVSELVVQRPRQRR